MTAKWNWADFDPHFTQMWLDGTTVKAIGIALGGIPSETIMNRRKKLGLKPRRNRATTCKAIAIYFSLDELDLLNAASRRHYATRSQYLRALVRRDAMEG